MYILGFDIGGTKCAVITAQWDGENITILKKEKCDTDHSVSGTQMLEKLIIMADGILEGKPDSIGISCGGPLDAKTGVIINPPNLPGWKNVPIVDVLQAYYGVKACLQNDANACAVAEWKFGAGKDCDNMVFLTFGTGLGAGLILNGKLYEGTNGNAGELGHIRLAEDGPEGYGKKGSFEGFCSGGGIAQLGYIMAQRAVENGVKPSYFQEGMRPEDVSARTIADAAKRQDPTAMEVYRISGSYLGKGLSLLMDILNPQRIIIGSIFARSQCLLRDAMKAEIDAEALAQTADCCQIVPSALGEEIGDYAAVATALL